MKNRFILVGSLGVLIGLMTAACQTGKSSESKSVSKTTAVSKQPKEKKQVPPAQPSPTKVDTPKSSAAGAPSADKTKTKPSVVEKKTPLEDPTSAVEKAPAEYTVRLHTTKGQLDIEVTKALAPKGADRFYNLVKIGYYTDVAFFRVIPGFMAQVGISGKPTLNRIWREARISDDPVRGSNTRGTVTFATSGPNSRTTQFFINFKNNARLDGMGFAPFGKLRAASLAVLDGLHGGYGEGAPRGRGPHQRRIQQEGNTYLKASFPQLDYIKSAEILK